MGLIVSGRLRGVVVALALLGAATSGCASLPKVQVTGSSASPALAPASFHLSSAGPVERLVSARLASRGFTEAPADAVAIYTVQCAYAVRPLAVGAYVPGDTPANAPKAVLASASKPPSWARHKRQAYSLVVDISETATGRPIYRARAASVARIDKASDLPALLAAAVLSPPTP